MDSAKSWMEVKLFWMALLVEKEKKKRPMLVS